MAQKIPLQRRENERDGVSNHEPHDCLLNHAQIKEIIKAPRHWPLCGEFTGEFPSQRASNANNFSIWWRQHVNKLSFIDRRVIDFLDHVSLLSPTALSIIREHYMYITPVYIPGVWCKIMSCIYNGNTYSRRDWLNIESKSWAPFQYPITRLIIRSP